MEHRPTDPWEIIKHAAVSIAVGAAISFLTVLLQEFVNWLHSIQPAAPGVIAGIGKYLYTWHSTHSA